METEAPCREQRHTTGDRTIDRHWRFVLLRNAITSFHSGQKTGKSFRFSRRDVGGVCDHVPGGIEHLRTGVVSAGRGAFDCHSGSHHCCDIDCSSGGLFRDCVPDKTEGVTGRCRECHCGDDAAR